jgi:hypothetical protein
LGFGKANESFKTFYDVWVGPPVNQTLSWGKYDSPFLQCALASLKHPFTFSLAVQEWKKPGHPWWPPWSHRRRRPTMAALTERLRARTHYLPLWWKKKTGRRRIEKKEEEKERNNTQTLYAFFPNNFYTQFSIHFNFHIQYSIFKFYSDFTA